jgi:hypothetical protein
MQMGDSGVALFYWSTGPAERLNVIWGFRYPAGRGPQVFNELLPMVLKGQSP